jgi:hypothetical protein
MFHAETDDQDVLRCMIQRGKRKMRHHFGDWSEGCHSNPVGDELPVHPGSGGDDRGSAVAQDVR